MRRQGASAVVVHQSVSSHPDDSIVEVLIQRDGRATFSVIGRRSNSDAGGGAYAWTECARITGLKQPSEIQQGLETVAKQLGSAIDWPMAIACIAPTDWLTAAVIARVLEHPLPPLPKSDVLLSQRSLRALGSVCLGAEWGYDMHELHLPFDRWVRILNGEGRRVSQPYRYEGERFVADWVFSGDGSLAITYSDSGSAWEGSLRALDLLSGPSIDGVDLAVLALQAANRRPTAQATLPLEDATGEQWSAEEMREQLSMMARVDQFLLHTDFLKKRAPSSLADADRPLASDGNLDNEKNRSLAMPVRKATPEEMKALFGAGLILFGPRPSSAAAPPSSQPNARQAADEDTRSPRCPYCDSRDECAHLLLTVDTTFRAAEGGLLMKAFNDRWYQLQDSEDPKFDERDAFDGLLEEMESWAHHSVDWDFEGGPGRSSGYRLFYVRSEEDARRVAQQFILTDQDDV